VSALQLVAPLVLFILAGYASVVDFRSMVIPDGVNLAIFVAGIATCFLLGPVAPVSGVAASVVGGGLMLGLELGFRAYRGYDGLGRGDVKFVAAAATWTGLEGVPVALFLASAAALAYVLGRRSSDAGRGAGERIPFGPFLAFGAVSVATLQIWSGMSWVDILDNLFP
jgi:leader peptidase (prepilin peptidase)/N-methyltransferase